MNTAPIRQFRPGAYAEKIAQATVDFLDQNEDYVQFAISSDPALKGLSPAEVKQQLQAYPGVRALAVHQQVRALYVAAEQEANEEKRGTMKTEARWYAEAAHSETGIDIHPGARMDSKTFIDHGTGVVIGEQARIGRGTRFYHDVTLGAAGAPPSDAPRHPELGKNCLVSVGVKILGHVVAGNDVTFGPLVTVQGNHVTIGNGVSISTSAKIGDGNRIADGVHIGTGVVIPNNIGLIDKNIPSFSQVSRGAQGELQFGPLHPSQGQDVSIGQGRA